MSEASEARKRQTCEMSSGRRQKKNMPSNSNGTGTISVGSGTLGVHWLIGLEM